MKEMLGGCCVCADENGWEANPLVYCDGPNCEVAVHQGCYGIVEVPEGEWYCAKCADMLMHLRQNGNGTDVDIRESPRCELCPFGHGALKRTETDGWAHVICALYIPEVRFGDVHSMDPVIISDVPIERFQQPCYLCTERGEDKRAIQGACMSCNKSGCKKGFHVTCAQAEGLLCEEGGGSKNVKYCGYCSAHAKKALGDPLIKVIPAYRHRAQSSSCSSTTSGGGHQFSPRFNNNCNGTPSNSDHFANRSTLSSASPAGSGVYSCSNHSASVTPLSATSSHHTPPVSASSTDGIRQRDGGAMLVDPLHRTPLPPTAVDRAMMSAVLSQPMGSHSLLDGNCSPPISSGRSSVVQNTQPAAAAALSSMKCEQPSNLEILASSATIMPLPPNMGTLVGGPIAKNDDKSPTLTEKTLNNGTLTTLPTVNLPPTTLFNSINAGAAPVVAAPRGAKRTRTSDSGDKPKRIRNNNKASKAEKALLESVGPLVSECVSDFQRELVSKRDAAAAAAAAAGISVPGPALPSTSGEPHASTSGVATSYQTGNGASVEGSSSSIGIDGSPPLNTNMLPSTSTAEPSNKPLVGVPLLRHLRKGLGSPEINQPSTSFDRHHASTSIPSTSLGVSTGGAQHSPFPQSMEELLERQWEQGSHFLMAHAPFDIAQLLSCLHELKMENVRLEETMAQLIRRRDHLLALNARLSLSLTNGAPVGVNSSPHHSPRVSGVAGAGVPLASTMPPSSMATASSASTSMSSAPLSSAVPFPPSAAAAALAQQCSSSTALGGTTSANPLLSGSAYSSNLSPIVDDSLNQLRSLAASGMASAPRNGPSSTASQLPAAVAPPAVGRPASRHTPASIVSGTALPQASQAPFTPNRIPSTASANSAPAASTPSSTANGATSTTPKSCVVGMDPLAVGGTATTISPERQQQLAAAAVAAAAANAIGGGFLTPRAPGQLNTSGATSNTLGQFAPQDLLAQYALLAQQQLIHQQAAAAAALRYSGLVMQGNSTPPNTTSSSQTTNTAQQSQSGKRA